MRRTGGEDAACAVAAAGDSAQGVSRLSRNGQQAAFKASTLLSALGCSTRLMKSTAYMPLLLHSSSFNQRQPKSARLPLVEAAGV